MTADSTDRLARRLGLRDSVVIGMGAMIGAGVFASLAPAAQAAGSWLLLGLAVAAVVAYCNAMSSAWLAARYPEAGGTYLYGRERLGHFWGYLDWDLEDPKGRPVEKSEGRVTTSSNASRH